MKSQPNHFSVSPQLLSPCSSPCSSAKMSGKNTLKLPSSLACSSSRATGAPYSLRTLRSSAPRAVALNICGGAQGPLVEGQKPRGREAALLGDLLVRKSVLVDSGGGKAFQIIRFTWPRQMAVRLLNLDLSSIEESPRISRKALASKPV